MFLPDSSDFLCPVCKSGNLQFRDRCKRIRKLEGGDKEWISIPRHQCDNPSCRRIHRMLPDFLVPFKHYQETVIVDAIDDRIVPEESDDRPSETTVLRWKLWLMLNAANIDGHLKSIGHRELGFSAALMESGISLLNELRKILPEGWLREILRIIYNSGAKLSSGLI